MPFLVRADLDAFRGPEYIDRLLRVAGDNPTSQQQALDGALDRGEQFLREYLPAEALTSADADVLRPIGAAEAIFELQRLRDMGASDAEWQDHQLRVAKLGDMRKRKRWPGGPDNQRAVEIGIVESDRRLDRASMRKGVL